MTSLWDTIIFICFCCTLVLIFTFHSVLSFSPLYLLLIWKQMYCDILCELCDTCSLTNLYIFNEASLGFLIEAESNNIPINGRWDFPESLTELVISTLSNVCVCFIFVLIVVLPPPKLVMTLSSYICLWSSVCVLWSVCSTQLSLLVSVVCLFLASDAQELLLSMCSEIAPGLGDHMEHWGIKPWSILG